jgi:hypothetical protein
MKNMLAIVYCPFEQKENQQFKRVLGCWRHSSYVQCFTGHFAMTIFDRLNTHAIELDLQHPRYNQPLAWWIERALPDWNTTDACYDAYKNILERAGVDTDELRHIAHIRSSATEHASHNGALALDIITTEQSTNIKVCPVSTLCT